MPKRDKDLQKCLDWDNNLCDISNELHEIAWELGQLSEAFYITGNSEMGVKMFEYGMEIQKLGERVRKAMGDKIDHDLKKSQEGLAFTLKAVLNSIIPKEENDEKETNIS